MHADIVFPPDEEWLELKQDHRYVISTHGRLYDLAANRFVRASLISSSGKRVLVWNIREARSTQPSRTRVIRAAGAVLGAFWGPGWYPSFLDGDITNVRLDNLYWKNP